MDLKLHWETPAAIIRSLIETLWKHTIGTSKHSSRNCKSPACLVLGVNFCAECKWISTAWVARKAEPVYLVGSKWCGHLTSSSRMRERRQRQVEEMPVPTLSHRKEKHTVNVSMPQVYRKKIREETEDQRDPRALGFEGQFEWQTAGGEFWAGEQGQGTRWTQLHSNNTAT